MTLSDLVASDAPAEEVALAIAADEYPSLHLPRCRQLLDEFAAGMATSALTTAGGEPGRLCRHVYGELGFAGCDDYDDPRANYLSDVLERRSGSPVAMAVVLIAVGRRAGMIVDGIGFPGHFLVRCGGEYIDPFDGRHPIDRQRLVELAAQTLGDEREATARLEPVGVRTVAVRLLLNLQRIHRQRGDHARSLVTCDRLFELTAAPFHQADRGAHALALGATRSALADFNAYLEAHPRAADADTIRALISKARRLLINPAN